MDSWADFLITCSLSRGSIKAMGPHMPKQWRLPKSPRTKAEVHIALIGQFLFMHKGLPPVLPADGQVPSALDQALVGHEQGPTGELQGKIPVQLSIGGPVQGYRTADLPGFISLGEKYHQALLGPFQPKARISLRGPVRGIQVLLVPQFLLVIVLGDQIVPGPVLGAHANHKVHDETDKTNKCQYDPGSPIYLHSIFIFSGCSHPNPSLLNRSIITHGAHELH